MVWGNFFGKNLLDFGGVWTLAWIVWGTFFRDELPQSARLSAGGVQSLKGQCPNAWGDFFGGASLTISQLRNKDPKGPRKFLKEEAHISTKVGPEVSAGEIIGEIQ